MNEKKPPKLYPLPKPSIGFRGPPVVHCKKCRKRMVWGRTENDKDVPLSIDHPDAKWDGAVCLEAPSHFTDCVAAASFSKGRKPQ